MKKSAATIFATIVLFTAVHQKSYAQKIRTSDTVGVADIEDRMDDLKIIAESMTTGMSACGNIDSLKRFAAILQQVDDTLINHINPIFNGFNILHPEQYEPMKNMHDLADLILDTRNLSKAKKYGDKMVIEYNNLMKAK
jgi:hypothetical protein